ncbi:hypothetical protein CGZ94_20950 [Enemella evansiae]|uniref:Uncharacterized protein n=1 Tax=Enemella evansiae TaxID=2016499 RepID=A0A255FW45_9ACTN|nr:hypothetical protein [Enemella evansiae]OYN93432.1 hypothetical protein CGZ95_18940 [Enemella evansiae]OYO07930.1 hypothetical protein CGZ94_20950 [Enemella evansiae]OYO14947.1 hypothetical protein CGZ98_00360 [Enemella evansiae]
MSQDPETKSPSPRAETAPELDFTAVRAADVVAAGADRSRGRRILAKALRKEAAGWRSIARAVTRRPWVPVGATGFHYDSTVRGPLIAFTVVSVVEVVAVDLLTQRWPAVRFPLLVLGIWGALFMVGMLLGNITHPHAVGPAGISMRSGGDIDLEFPWSAIHSVAHRVRRHPEAPGLGVTGPPERLTLMQVIDERTNMEIVFEEPWQVRLPDGTLRVEKVQLYADHPREFLAAAREHLRAYEATLDQ